MVSVKLLVELLKESPRRLKEKFRFFTFNFWGYFCLNVQEKWSKRICQTVESGYNGMDSRLKEKTIKQQLKWIVGFK